MAPFNSILCKYESMMEDFESFNVNFDKIDFKRAKLTKMKKSKLK